MLTLRNMKIIFNYACLSGGLALDYEHLYVPVKHVCILNELSAL